MTHADTVAGPVGPPGLSASAEQAEQAGPAELVRRHRSRVLRLATRLTGNRSDAEDLTQEVFVRALTAGDTLRPDAVEGWLHRVTTNLFLDHARRRSRVRVDPWGEHLETRVRPAAAADVTLLGATFESDVEAALEALAPAVRAVVVLVDLEGLSYAEAASVLGLKLGTVRSRLHRGRSQLRRALAHRDPAQPSSTPPARQFPTPRVSGRRGPRMGPPGLLGPPPLSV